MYCRLIVVFRLSFVVFVDLFLDFAICWWFGVVCLLLLLFLVVRCLLFVGRFSLFVVRCLLVVVCYFAWLLFVVCCSMLGVRCFGVVCCLLFVGFRMLFCVFVFDV